MRLGLVTTTINIPHVLKFYRAHGPDVRFFVAVDQKTPEEAVNFCYALDNVEIIQPLVSKWKSDPLIGYNTDSRRNFAVLAALEWGADILFSIDDDMPPMGADVFTTFEKLFAAPFSGLKIGEPNSWTNPCAFAQPPHPVRGLPPDTPTVNTFGFIADASIGAAQGIICGVPDATAPAAMTNAPFVTGATDILRSGFVADPAAYTVFNSQFTCFRRELAPAFVQFYKSQGRNTDIFASLMMRRVMRELNLYTYFGPPFGFHARKVRPLFPDLKAEMYGMEFIAESAEWLDGYTFREHATPRQMVRSIWEKAGTTHIVPEGLTEVALAWCDDCDEAMK